MSLKDQIKDDIKVAMRAKDQARLDSLRMLAAAIQRREVDERVVLDDTQVLAVVDKLVKQSREAVVQFAQGGRHDLVEKENRDIGIWQLYLPRPLTPEEIDRLVAEAIAASGASSVKDMGKVMAALKPKLQGRADMAQVSNQIKTRLNPT